MTGRIARWGGYGAAALAVTGVSTGLALAVVGISRPEPAPVAGPVPVSSAPVSSAPVSSAPADPASAASTAAPVAAVGVEQVDGITYYTVQPFDVGRREGTLAFLATRFGTTVPQIVAWNHIENPDVIHPGQRLRVT